jgi:hypothetical protein
MISDKVTKELFFERGGELEEKPEPESHLIQAGSSHLNSKECIYKVDTNKNICELKSHLN